MTITAKVIESSVSMDGHCLTTMQLVYPRFIHAEFMTHRVFSRNASSSRAIPVAKMIEAVRTSPAMPIHWGANQPGMQANQQLNAGDIERAKNAWCYAAEKAAQVALDMEALGLHKQVANRILEPFQHIHVVVTATEWSNFFALRDHKDAQPEIHELAIQMRQAMEGSKPKLLRTNEWHLPYVSEEEKITIAIGVLRKASAARCARVSYLTHDGLAPDMDKDLELYERLVGSVPAHASPVEHQATPDAWDERKGDWKNASCHGNFRGWVQFRKLLENSFFNREESTTKELA